MQGGTFHCGVCGRGTAQQAGRAHHSTSRFMGCWDWLFEGPVDGYDSLILADVSYVVRHLAGWRSQLPTLVLEHTMMWAPCVFLSVWPSAAVAGRGQARWAGGPRLPRGANPDSALGATAFPPHPPNAPPPPPPTAQASHTDGDPLPLGPFPGHWCWQARLVGGHAHQVGALPNPVPPHRGRLGRKAVPPPHGSFGKRQGTMRWEHLSSGSGSRGWEGGSRPGQPLSPTRQPPPPRAPHCPWTCPQTVAVAAVAAGGAGGWE